MWLLSCTKHATERLHCLDSTMQCGGDIRINHATFTGIAAAINPTPRTQSPNPPLSSQQTTSKATFPIPPNSTICRLAHLVPPVGPDVLTTLAHDDCGARVLAAGQDHACKWAQTRTAISIRAHLSAKAACQPHWLTAFRSTSINQPLAIAGITMPHGQSG